MARQNVLVVGCGRLGGLLANNLSAKGHPVVVLDRKDDAFDQLSVEFSGYRVVGDATELNVLRQARIEQANYLFATTTLDNINIMVAQIGKMVFDVPHVVARVYDPVRERIYSELGIDTISPTQLSAKAFMQAIQFDFAQEF